MATATVLRDIAMLAGKPRKTGEILPAEVVDPMSPQTKIALVSNGLLDIEGVEASRGGSDMHLRAKLDQMAGTIRTLQASLDDAAARIAKLEGEAVPSRRAQRNKG